MKTTVLLDAIVKEVLPVSESGFGGYRFNPSGEPHAKAVVDAVIDAYPVEPGIADKVTALAEAVTKVTVAFTGSNMLGAPAIYAAEVKLMIGRSGSIAMLPKGARSQGYRLAVDTVLDVLDGYGRIGELKAKVAAVKDSLPTVVPLSKDDLLALPQPTGGERSPAATLAVFGTWRLPDGDSPAAIWVFSEYSPEDDIADGVLFIKEADGYSEHGSVYGEQLLSGRFGKVAGFAGMSFKEAVGLTGGSYEAAVEAVKGAVAA